MFGTMMDMVAPLGMIHRESGPVGHVSAIDEERDLCGKDMSLTARLELPPSNLIGVRYSGMFC